MSLVKSLFNLYFLSLNKGVERFIDIPIITQELQFKRLIKMASKTIWGKRYHFNEINSMREFQDRVPLQEYDTLKSYIQLMIEGERDVLWPGEVRWFAKSSGTTSDKSKFLPITKDSLEDCHFRGGKDVLNIYCNQMNDSSIFEGKCLVLGGSHKIHELNARASAGDLSAVLIQNMPLVTRTLRAPSLDIALMEDWEEKIMKMAEEAIHETITHMAGVPTWTLVLVKKVLEITGKDNLADVWPNLELYSHGGVNFSPYRDQFKQLIRSDKMHYQETYNASEGFFGIQNDLKSDDMLLMLDYGIFYEFIPFGELENENPKVVSLGDVELNKIYALVISTSGGLWRYKIGDTIKFTSLDPYKVKVVGRTKHFINAFGEELMIENCEKALESTCNRTNASVKDYTAAPIYFGESNNGGHEWVIEFDKAPSDLEQFAQVLDEQLKKQNSDYEAKRYKDIAMRPPTIHVASQDTFYQWLKQKNKLGGQHKIPRLANDRIFMEEILQVLKS